MVFIQINKDKINSKNIVFAFDLHAVIFRLSTKKIIKEIYNCPFKIKLISTFFYPRIIFRTIKELKRGAIAEEILLNLVNEFPQYKELMPTGFNIINAQEPIYETINILKKLKESGYKIYILSNIGEKSIELLQKKFEEIFNLFDGILASNQNDGFIKKPNPKAFEKFLKKFNYDTENVIFIDDRISNINAALNLNIFSIQFINPQLLLSKLQEIKVI